VRTNDAEREHVVSLLRIHLDDGRLDLDEYGDRVHKAFAAESREDLHGLLADLPPVTTPPAQPPRGRRHGEGARPNPGWRPTNERFRDPSTNRIMRVWIDPATGSRHYVSEV
jgi:hypothetical protein